MRTSQVHKMYHAGQIASNALTLGAFGMMPFFGLTLFDGEGDMDKKEQPAFMAGLMAIGIVAGCVILSLLLKASFGLLFDYYREFTQLRNINKIFLKHTRPRACAGPIYFSYTRASLIHLIATTFY